MNRMTNNSTVEKFKLENPHFFSQPIVKSFLSDNTHHTLLENALEFPSKKNIELLDNAFKIHFSEIKLIKLISSTIYYYSIDFDKRIRKERSRYPLIVDKPTNDNNEILFKDLIVSDFNIDSYLEMNNNLENLLEDEQLINALAKLTKKQKFILNAYYNLELKDVEIAKIMGVTQQSISKSRNRALEKLRLLLNIDKEDEDVS